MIYNSRNTNGLPANNPPLLNATNANATRTVGYDVNTFIHRKLPLEEEPAMQSQKKEREDRYSKLNTGSKTGSTNTGSTNTGSNTSSNTSSKKQSRSLTDNTLWMTSKHHGWTSPYSWARPEEPPSLQWVRQNDYRNPYFVYGKKQQRKRGLGGVFGAATDFFFGGDDGGQQTSSTVKYTASVQNVQELRNNVSVMNQQITKSMVDVSNTSINDLSQEASLILSNIVAENNLEINVSSSQTMRYFDHTKIDVNIIQQVVKSIATDVQNSMINALRSETVSNLKNAVDQNQTNSFLNQLLSNSGGNSSVSQTLDTNVSLRNEMIQDFQSSLSSVTSTENCQKIAILFQNSFKQNFSLYISNLRAKNIKITASVTQVTDFVKELVANMQLQTKVMESMNNSSIFNIDQKTLNALSNTSESTASNKVGNETVAGSLQTVGDVLMKPMTLLGEASKNLFVVVGAVVVAICLGVISFFAFRGKKGAGGGTGGNDSGADISSDVDSKLSVSLVVPKVEDVGKGVSNQENDVAGGLMSNLIMT